MLGARLISHHSIPVPVGWSPEQTWEHMSRGELLEHPNGDPAWTNVEVEGLTTEPIPDGEKVTGGRLVRWWK